MCEYGGGNHHCLEHHTDLSHHQGDQVLNNSEYDLKSPSTFMQSSQPIEFNNLNHEAAFRNIAALLLLVVTIILGSANCFFYTQNKGWFDSMYKK